MTLEQIEKKLGRKPRSGETAGVIAGRAPATREEKMKHEDFLRSLQPKQSAADEYEEFIDGHKRQTPDDVRRALLAKMRTPPAEENPRKQKYQQLFDEIGFDVRYSESQFLMLKRMEAALEAGNDAAFDAQHRALRTSVKESIEQQKEQTRKQAEVLRSEGEQRAAEVERQGEVFGLAPAQVEIRRDERGNPIIEGGLPAGMTLEQWEQEQQRKAMAMELLQ